MKHNSSSIGKKLKIVNRLKKETLLEERSKELESLINIRNHLTISLITMTSTMK